LFKGEVMRIYRFNEIDSTNKFLREKEDILEEDVAIAKIQTAGRGRRGNKWSSTEGAALFSFVLKHDDGIEEDQYMKLPLLVGYSLLYSLKEIEDLDYKFKWTNDLYLDEKKISGILVEKINSNYIIGIGLNLNNLNLEEAKDIGISLKEKTGKNYPIEEIIQKVVKDFYKNFKKFKAGNWNDILKKINNVNYLFGKRIDIVSIETEESGIAGNILEDGTLEVFVGDKIKKYNVGSIHISKK
jgi:BirA family biotin operon repressor/biotin-[acetyl-CoA-carboxylase] ligase